MLVTMVTMDAAPHNASVRDRYPPPKPNTLCAVMFLTDVCGAMTWV